MLRALRGLRLVLVGDDVHRGEVVARAMRVAGADVRLSSLSPSTQELERLAHFDPTVIVIGEGDVSGRGHQIFRRARLDPRMRWASLLVVRWPKILPDPSAAPRLEGIERALVAQAEPERTATAQTLGGKPFTVQLETLGPARLLRVLAVRRSALELTWDNPRVSANVKVAKGELWSAHASTQEGAALEGLDALAAILVLRSGSVCVAPCTMPDGAKALGRVSQLLDQPTSAPSIPTSLFPRSPVEFVPPSTHPTASPSQHPDPPAPAGLRAPRLPSGVTPAMPSSGAQPNLASKLLEGDAAGVTPEQATGSEAWLVRSIRIGSFSVPHWLVLAAGGALIAAALFFGSRPDRRSRTTAQAPSDERSSVDIPPTEKSADPNAPSVLLARARRGESAALDNLEALAPSERTRAQAFAIGQGRLVKARADVAALGNKLTEDPTLLEDKQTTRRLIAYGRDDFLAPTALGIMAELPGETGADLLYQTWTGVRERTEATRLAQALVFSKEVRNNASPALRAVLDLRSTKDCVQMIEVLQRTKKHGDRRAMSVIAKLTLRRGCGPSKRRDCFPCLRKTKDLAGAMRAAQRRAAPRF